MNEPTPDEVAVMLQIVTQQRNAALDQIVMLAAKLELCKAENATTQKSPAVT
jgi:hypothetical protein